MGKNKGGGKKASVFKVVGAKSLKAKSKAKQFTGNLKKINEIVRKNVDRIDKNLVNLQDDIRQKKEEKAKAKPNSSKKVASEVKMAADFEKEKQKTLEKLTDMQF